MTARWRQSLERAGLSRHRDVAIFGLTIVVGAVYFLTMMGGEVGAAGDTPTYVELSRGVFSGSGFQLNGRPSATYPPGYPIFLAPFVLLFGDAGLPVVITQWLLAALCAVSIARIATIMYSSTTGLLAGIGAATAPQLAMWAAFPISDVLGLTLLLIGLLFMFKALPPESASTTTLTGLGKPLRSAILTGAFFGASAMVRPLSLSLALPALSWLALPWARGTLRRRLGMLAVVVLAMVIVISPWAVRNAFEFGGFFPLSTRNGWQLIQATEWNLEGRGTVGVDVTYPEEAAGLDEAEADRLLVEIALNRITADPGDFLRRAVTKTVFLWLPTAPGLGLASLVMGLYFCGIAALAASAFIWRDVRRGVIFWVMAAGASAGVALTILDPDYRYRLPVLMVLLPPATLCVSRLMRVDTAKSRG